ncbi:hypothetical protein PSAC2689_20218 [Paraburkholderia sacchari]
MLGLARVVADAGAAMSRRRFDYAAWKRLRGTDDLLPARDFRLLTARQAQDSGAATVARHGIGNTVPSWLLFFRQFSRSSAALVRRRFFGLFDAA